MSISPSPQFSKPQSSASRSSSPARQSLITRAFLLAALLVTAAGAALASAPAVQAHDELVSTNPAAGARLDTAPAELELTFSSALMDLGNQVQVLDAEGRNWAETAVVLNRETLLQPLPGNMPNGAYSVNWRAVSSDGHPITGTFEFAVGAEAAGPEASAGAPETAEATESTDAADSTATPDATETVEATEASDDGRPAWLVPGIIGGVTGLVLYAAYTFVSRRRQQQAERQPEE